MGLEQFFHVCFALLMALPQRISICPRPSSSGMFKYISCSTFCLFSECSILVLLGLGLSSILLRILPTFVIVFISVSLLLLTSHFSVEPEFTRAVLVDLAISVAVSSFLSLRI